MKQLLFSIMVLFPLFLLAGNVHAQQLGSFPSLLQDEVVDGTTVKASYPKLTTYFGVGNSNSNVRYLYVWIPVPTNDVGLRVVSPMGELVPNSADAVEKGADKQKNISFDPGVTFEIPAEPIKVASEIIKSGSSTKWQQTLSNDDSNEIFAQPNGKFTNAVTHAALTAPILQGLYRVKISAEKATQLKGSFCLQMGALANSNGIVIAKDLSTLFKLVNNP